MFYFCFSLNNLKIINNNCFSIFQNNCFTNYRTCSICYLSVQKDEMLSLACGHQFCKDCWDNFFQIQIQQGITTGILF